jgi:hypothetical protein
MSRSILKPAHVEAMAAFDANGSATTPEATAADVPRQIMQWLAQLKLLHNVPFRYLVPDERMLPPESIRFFHVDLNWLDALIDGAYSIGRYASGLGQGTLHNRVEGALAESLAPALNRAARSRRRQQFGAAMADDPAPFEAVTGFLLRSQVVKGWPGLQANAYAKGNSPEEPTWDGTSLKALRLEHLSEETFFGLFEGDCHRLDLHEPSEGLHFGFDASQDGRRSKKLRDPATGASLSTELAGEDFDAHDIFRPAPKGAMLGAPERTERTGRVLNLYNLSALLFSRLTAAQVGYEQPVAALTASGTAVPVSGLAETMHPLAASDFALQMVHGVGMVSFYNSDGAQHGG